MNAQQQRDLAGNLEQSVPQIGTLTATVPSDNFAVGSDYWRMGGLKTSFDTLAMLIGVEKSSLAPNSIYRISKDPNPSNNGIYEFNGTLPISANSFTKISDNPDFGAGSKVVRFTIYDDGFGGLTENPNIDGTVFNPNITANSNAIYVSDWGSVWIWNSLISSYKKQSGFHFLNTDVDPNTLSSTGVDEGVLFNPSIIYVNQNAEFWRYLGDSESFEKINLKQDFNIDDAGSTAVSKGVEVYNYSFNGAQTISFSPLSTFENRNVFLINPTSFNKNFQSGFTYTDIYGQSKNVLRAYSTLVLHNSGTALREISSSQPNGVKIIVANISIGNNTVTHGRGLPTGKFSDLVYQAFDSSGNEIVFRRIFASDTTNAIVVNSTSTLTNITFYINFLI